jgi:hypothetical protein
MLLLDSASSSFFIRLCSLLTICLTLYSRQLFIPWHPLVLATRGGQVTFIILGLEQSLDTLLIFPVMSSVLSVGEYGAWPLFTRGGFGLPASDLSAWPPVPVLPVGLLSTILSSVTNLGCPTPAYKQV